MKERPILFSAPMVRAILAGTKSQTRRIVKPQPASDYTDVFQPDFEAPRPVAFWARAGEPLTGDFSAACPYGQPGDRLWVRETCRSEERCDDLLDGVRYLADNAWTPIDNNKAAADGWVTLYHYRGQRGATVPPIHMPRWASRITLEITGVRVERVQEISEADAKAEGVKASDASIVTRDGEWRRDLSNTARGAYCCLWESINGAGSWEANPFVWVVTFRRIQP